MGANDERNFLEVDVRRTNFHQQKAVATMRFTASAVVVNPTSRRADPFGYTVEAWAGPPQQLMSGRR